jgi:anti-anti-sigma factor
MPYADARARADQAVNDPNNVVFSHFCASPDLRVLMVRGELDIATSGLFQHELDDLLKTGIPRVEVDLAGVEFMDSSALSALVGAHERARKSGQQFALLSPSPVCAKVLGITGLDHIFELV